MGLFSMGSDPLEKRSGEVVGEHLLRFLEEVALHVVDTDLVEHGHADGVFNEFRNDEFVDQRESKRPWDIRYINAPTGPLGEPVTDDQRMWMRLDEAIGEELELHQAALAYLSDATLIDHIVLPHGLRWESPDVDGTSLDHAMWFYRGARADEWLLFDQHVESTGDARGLVSGRFFTRSGELIATCCQEGLMRWDAT